MGGFYGDEIYMNFYNDFMKYGGHHPVYYDQKSGIWVCQKMGCAVRMAVALGKPNKNVQKTIYEIPVFYCMSYFVAIHGTWVLDGFGVPPFRETPGPQIQKVHA